VDSRLALKIVTASEMRQIDRITSERLGVPSLTLMENAGSAVAEFVMSAYPLIRHVGVICGKGNNGGDGLVAARKLHDAGRAVRVLLLAEPAELQGDALEMLRRLPVSPAEARSSRNSISRTRGRSLNLNSCLTPSSARDLNRRSAASTPRRSHE